MNERTIYPEKGVEELGIPFFTTSEFAKMTGYGQDTISEYARKGKIVPQPKKRGNDWWISPDAQIIRYRESSRQPGYNVIFISRRESRTKRD